MGLFDIFRKKNYQKNYEVQRYNNIEKDENLCPVKFEGLSIKLNTNHFMAWQMKRPVSQSYSAVSTMRLSDRAPVISLYEDDILIHKYTLEPDKKDFTNKYFHVCVNFHMSFADDSLPIVQIDGYVSDNAKPIEMSPEDVGFRFEGYFTKRGGLAAENAYASIRGKDLIAKGLERPGAITPQNVRLICVCPECRQSFVLSSLNLPHMACEPFYSENGLDMCVVPTQRIEEHGLKNEKSTFTLDEKVFNYYNSLNCPHCGVPYIDYKKYPDMKNFGNLGYFLSGKKVYVLANLPDKTEQDNANISGSNTSASPLPVAFD